MTGGLTRYLRLLHVANSQPGLWAPLTLNRVDLGLSGSAYNREAESGVRQFVDNPKT
jgi:hypothetical protein